MTQITTVPNSARVLETDAGTAIKLSKAALPLWIDSLSASERQRIADLNPELRDMIAKAAPPVAPTIEDMVTAARERVAKARRAREAHERAIAPVWGCKPESVAYELSKRGSPDAAYAKYLAAETEAVNELLTLPTRASEQVAKSFDGLIDASKGVMDTMAETHSLAHHIPLGESHSFLSKNSSQYAQSANLYANAVTEKSNAVAAAEMRARAAIDGPAYDTAIASAQHVDTPYQTAGEQAVMARASELAKHRGVTVERALADGLANGANGDATLKSLYGQASTERWKLGIGGTP